MEDSSALSGVEAGIDRLLWKIRAMGFTLDDAGLSEALVSYTRTLIDAPGALSRRDRTPRKVLEHIEDSASVLEVVPEIASARAIGDIGSGNGLPGIVVALLLDGVVSRPARSSPALGASAEGASERRRGVRAEGTNRGGRMGRAGARSEAEGAAVDAGLAGTDIRKGWWIGSHGSPSGSGRALPLIESPEKIKNEGHTTLVPIATSVDLALAKFPKKKDGHAQPSLLSEKNQIGARAPASPRVFLVERSRRKRAFLRRLCIELGVPAVVAGDQDPPSFADVENVEAEPRKPSREVAEGEREDTGVYRGARCWAGPFPVVLARAVAPLHGVARVVSSYLARDGTGVVWAGSPSAGKRAACMDACRAAGLVGKWTRPSQLASRGELLVVRHANHR